LREKYVNKSVVVTRGPWKGYVGICKGASEINFRVELHTNCKIISCPHVELVDKEKPMELETPKDRDENYFRTPSREVTETPSRPFMATPQHNEGTPQTNWGTVNEDSEYHAPTPGSNINDAPSPAFHQPTPGSGETPGVMNPTTPYTYETTPGFVSTPNTSNDIAPTPGSMETEETGSPRSPNSPLQVSADNDNWQIPDILVDITGGEHSGKTGPILEVLRNQGQCIVLVDNKNVQVPTISVKPAPIKAPPAQVKIIKGEYVGQTGELIHIDQNDGLVKMGGNSEIKIFELSVLAQLYDPNPPQIPTQN